VTAEKDPEGIRGGKALDSRPGVPHPEESSGDFAQGEASFPRV